MKPSQLAVTIALFVTGLSCMFLAFCFENMLNRVSSFAAGVVVLTVASVVSWKERDL